MTRELEQQLKALGDPLAGGLKLLRQAIMLAWFIWFILVGTMVFAFQWVLVVGVASMPPFIWLTQAIRRGLVLPVAREAVEKGARTAARKQAEPPEEKQSR